MPDASLPERLADADGELPEEIVKAIEAYGKAAFSFGRAFIDAEIKPTRATLTATILARLTAAESARDEADLRLAKALARLAELEERNGHN